MKNILILGGGFGGLYTAHHLLKMLNPNEAKITLVNRDNYFLFMPLLHEVATGNLHITNVVEPIRNLLKGDNFNFCKAEVQSVDLKKKQVKTSEGTIKYDYVVIALGSTNNFYDLKGSENCLTLKTLHDAFNIRNHVIEMFEKASMTKDKEERRRLLNFVIVGAGPTGVEIAAELADWIGEHCKHFKNIDEKDVNIAMIYPSRKVLKGLDEKLRNFTMTTLEKKGVKMIPESSVKRVGKFYVDYVGKSSRKLKRIKTYTPIWAAGVKPVQVPVTGITKERGKIPVEDTLHVKGYLDAFALGDIASYVNPWDTAHPPPTAQLAHRQSKGLSKNLVAHMKGRPFTPFIFKSDGFLASLGNGQAIADVKGFKFHGFFAWWMWRTIYWTKMVGVQNKIRIAFDWTMDLFFRRDTSQV